MNLSKNSIGDKGIGLLMDCLQYNKSLVCLNLSSNEISSVGFIKIFETMSYNESIINLNLSTIEGANRNRLSKKALNKFKQMLIKNKFIETLILSSVNLGNEGLAQIVKAFNHGLDDAVKASHAGATHGKFIQENKFSLKEKDYSVLPQLEREN